MDCHHAANIRKQHRQTCISADHGATFVRTKNGRLLSEALCGHGFRTSFAGRSGMDDIHRND